MVELFNESRRPPARPLSPNVRAGWFWRIVQFPLTRIIVLGITSVLAPGLAIAGLTALTGGNTDPLRSPLALAGGVLVSVVTYLLLTRLMERRPVSELQPASALRELGIGAAIGFCAITATVLLMWLAGVYRVTAMNSAMALLPALGIGILPAFTEEILFRGVLYRIVEASLGTWAALIATSLLFGASHLANPNASWFAALAIAIEAGLMLGIAYTRTQRLWVPIGIHFAWNWAQGGVFGVPVSGNAVTGLLTATIQGPELLAGGGFGAESTVFAIGVCVLIFIVLLRDTYRKNWLILPFWQRRVKTMETQSPTTPA